MIFGDLRFRRAGTSLSQRWVEYLGETLAHSVLPLVRDYISTGSSAV